MTTNNKQVRTRYAPSPTGFTHIGNFRTALFAFLFARHNEGVFVVRVEDTDQSRKVDGAIENMISILDTLGIHNDEGPYVEAGAVKEKGSFGPYTQSHRLEIYQKYAKELLESNKAYYCFCSSERLDELRKEQVALKQPPMYDRHCRNLTEEEVAEQNKEFEAEEKKPVVRMAIPEQGETVVHDLVFGDITYAHAILDDQVLIKSDGFPTYHMAVVVDDHLMEITHVIRGDDWLPSTPKHVLLYEAFGWETPNFAHLPLILNPDKTKLSKRQGDVAVEDFLQKGYLPEALVNFVAFLGWNPKTEQELFSMEDLISHFNLEQVNKAGSVLDTIKLDWMNSLYIRNKPEQELLEACKPYWTKAGVSIREFSDEYLLAVIKLEKDRLKKLSDITDNRFYFELPEYESQILVWKKSTAEDAKEKLTKLSEFFENLSEENYEQSKLEIALKQFIANNGFDNGSVLWPLRVSLTGLEKSPGPFEVASTLFVGVGKEGIVERLQKAIQKL